MQNIGGGAPAAGDVGMGATGGGGAFAADGRGVSKFNLLDSGLLGAMATFVPGLFAKVSRKHRAAEITQTALDANVKLDKLIKVEALFSYLSGELPPKIDAHNLNFDSIRLINRLFKRVFTDVASLDSIRSNRESTIQDVYGILHGTNTGKIIREGKDASLLKFVGVLREVGINLGIPANSTPQQIREWFADEANQGVLRGVTVLNLSDKNLRHLPDEVDRFTNLEYLNLSNNPLNSVPDSIRSWFLALAKRSGRALEYASEGLRADRDMVLAVVTKHGLALEYASEGLRNDKAIVLAAVQQHGRALEYASEVLRADRGVVLAAVKKAGFVLEYASEGLRNDRGVVLAAVEEYGLALAYASLELQADRDIVLSAVEQHGRALEYASEGLRADRGVVLAAVTGEYPEARCFAADELKADPEIRAAAGLV